MKKNTKIIDAFFKIYIKQEFTLVCGNPTPEGGGVTWQGPGTVFVLEIVHVLYKLRTPKPQPSVLAALAFRLGSLGPPPWQPGGRALR